MITDLLLIAAGPARTRFARAKPEGAIEPSRVLDNLDEAGALEALTQAAGEMDAETSRVLLAGSGPLVERAAHALTAPDLPRLVRVVPMGERGLAIPQQVSPGTSAPTVGEGPGARPVLSPERLLAALAAHDRSRGACLVVTAAATVSVDFVDAFGVLHPGPVAPGLRSMLHALASAGFPRVEPPPGTGEWPAGPTASSASESLLLGCAAAIRGVAHEALDRFAEQHGAYPRVIATGDDAAQVLGKDELIEAVVPDLVLIGLHTAWRIDQTGPVEGAPTADGEEVEDGVDE